MRDPSELLSDELGALKPALAAIAEAIGDAMEDGASEIVIACALDHEAQAFDYLIFKDPPNDR